MKLEYYKVNDYYVPNIKIMKIKKSKISNFLMLLFEQRIYVIIFEY